MYYRTINLFSITLFCGAFAAHCGALDVVPTLAPSPAPSSSITGWVPVNGGTTYAPTSLFSSHIASGAAPICQSILQQSGILEHSTLVDDAPGIETSNIIFAPPPACSLTDIMQGGTGIGDAHADDGIVARNDDAPEIETSNIIFAPPPACSLTDIMQVGAGIGDAPAGDMPGTEISEIDADAAFRAGCELLDRNGPNYDREEALRYLRIAADNGNADAAFRAGDELLDLYGPHYNQEEALRYFQLAIDNGNAEAAHELGKIFHYGYNGVPLDTIKSAHYLRIAADNGHADAAYCTGYRLLEGDEEVPQNAEDAVHYFRIAADNGHTIAARALGLVLFDGLYGVPQNRAEAVHYLETAYARRNGDGLIAYKLGIVFSDGTDGVAKNPRKAVRYLKTASGYFPDANYRFGMILLNGADGVAKQPAKALRYLKDIQYGGHPLADFYAGKTLFEGDGVPQNKKEGMFYLNRAANNGNEDAIAFLADKQSLFWGIRQFFWDCQDVFSGIRNIFHRH
jgi:TPR repeat protein